MSGLLRTLRPVHTAWCRFRDDAVVMRRLNGWLTLFWIAAIPLSWAMGWLRSVTYVSALSLWALVAGHLSTWQAARVEVKQQEEAQAREENPIEERVVEKLIERTDDSEPARFW